MAMTAPVFDDMHRYRFQKIVLGNDSDAGLRAVIAIHSTALGPATGGLRMWTYPTEQDAITDAMRLARGMTYKYAAAGLDLGGGKAVIIGDPGKDKTEALLRAMGRMINQLGGEYITGEDVGTTLADMEIIHGETDHVVTLPEHCGGAGDISPFTAAGVIQAMRACAHRAWGTPDLTGRRVALQGLGVVGSKVLRLLLERGATVIATDTDSSRTAAAAQQGAITVSPEEIYDADADIFAPCALGGIINDDTVRRLRTKVIAGAANNIFAQDRHGGELMARGVIYAVDYVANSGGTIYDTDRLRAGGFQPDRARAAVERIHDRIQEIFTIADQDGIPYQRAADQLAENRLRQAERHPRPRESWGRCREL